MGDVYVWRKKLQTHVHVCHATEARRVTSMTVRRIEPIWSDASIARYQQVVALFDRMSSWQRRAEWKRVGECG